MLIRQYRDAMTQPVTPVDLSIVDRVNQKPLPQFMLSILAGVDFLIEQYRCWLARRRTRAIFAAMSPRGRADIGIDAGNIDQVVADAVTTAAQQRSQARRLARAQHLAYQRTRRELMALDDRELQDIGIGRGDIERLARDARLNVAEAIVANPETTPAANPSAANDGPREAAVA